MEKKKLLLAILCVQLFLSLFTGLRLWGNVLFSAQKYERAIAVDPWNHVYRYALGTGLARGSKFVKQSYITMLHAEVHLRRAVELYPGYVNAMGNLAVVLVAQKKWEEAEVLFRRALSIAPWHYPISQNLEALQKIKARKEAFNGQKG